MTPRKDPPALPERVIGLWNYVNIKALQEAMRMTGAQLARELGMSVSMVHTWQSPACDRQPSWTNQLKFDKLLAELPQDVVDRFHAILLGCPSCGRPDASKTLETAPPCKRSGEMPPCMYPKDYECCPPDSPYRIEDDDKRARAWAIWLEQFMPARLRRDVGVL